MPITTVFRFKNHALMMALAAVYPAFSYGAGAARLDFASGNVTAVSAAGAQRGLNKGAEVGSGEAVVTGDGGRAQLRFTDGGMVSLQPGSEFKIDNYRFSGKEDGEEKGFFSLLRGGLRSITGLVGRNNKSAYKVTTNVATIGIRGTEFTIAYTGANSIAVSTGEGMIEVCNNAGCAVVPAGSSVTVSGPNTRIERSDVKPRLDPAQPPVDVQPVFSTSEQRQGNGLIQPVSAPLVSGSDYVVSYSGTKSGSAVIAGTGVGTPAIFDEFSTLQGFSYGGYDYKASSVAGSFSMDGVIGWGKWTEGETVPTGYGSPEALKEFHYVTGKPTPTSDLVALGTISAVYQLAGFTLPTSSTGVVGSAPSGTLNVNFSGGSATSIVANVNVPIGGSTYNLNTLVGSGSGGQTFSISSGGAYVNGFFAGANASHAGLTYKFNSVVGEVQGAAAFKR
ncbi:MAG TPA: FecR family protein [Accumulibacter sp.]|nr:FecR family protein [Accumulibacter sp.]